MNHRKSNDCRHAKEFKERFKSHNQRRSRPSLHSYEEQIFRERYLFIYSSLKKNPSADCDINISEIEPHKCSYQSYDGRHDYLCNTVRTCKLDNYRIDIRNNTVVNYKVDRLIKDSPRPSENLIRLLILKTLTVNSLLYSYIKRICITVNFSIGFLKILNTIFIFIIDKVIVCKFISSTDGIVYNLLSDADEVIGCKEFRLNDQRKKTRNNKHQVMTFKICSRFTLQFSS